jgi:hypothetical protein
MLLEEIFLDTSIMKIILLFGEDFKLPSGLLYRSIFSATDPIAVVCFLKQIFG